MVHAFKLNLLNFEIVSVDSFKSEMLRANRIPTAQQATSYVASVRIT